ncbi:MAG: cell division protein FtsQ/DivIB [Bacteroidales bacterium]
MNNRVLIKVYIIFTVIIVTISIPLLVGLLKISSVDLSIQYPSTSVIITKQYVQEVLFDKFGNLTNYRRNHINTKVIKKYLEELDFVDYAYVSVSLSGILRIYITQKLIIARIYNHNGKQFYMDSKMGIIDVQRQQQIAKCFIVTGHDNEIPIKKIDSLTDKDYLVIYKLAMLIHNDDILSKWISGVTKKDQKWIMLPSQGDYTITLNEDSSFWEEEINRLHYLIEYSFSKRGWDDYENIDLRFYNQVVCTKKE